MKNEYKGTKVEQIFMDDILENEPAESPIKEKKAKVVKGNLNLRAKSTKDSEVIAVIPDGSEIIVSESVGVWLRAKFGDKQGWVMAEFVEIEE